MTASLPMSSEMLGSTITTGPADDNAVDSYASKLLELRSPPEACIDECLGPYITSMLRSWMPPNADNVRELPEFNSLLELLEEQCNLNAESAQSVIVELARVVRTRIVPAQLSGDVNKSSRLLDSVLKDTQLQEIVLPPKSGDGKLSSPSGPNTMSNSEHTGTPLKPDRLIPVDLMGVLDDPSTPTTKKKKSISDPFPPLGASAPSRATKSKSKKALRKGERKDEKELVEALFHQSKPRQQSFDDSHKPTIEPPPSDQDPGQHNTPYAQEFEQKLYEQQVETSVEMLLSMNPTLGENAARNAALLANGDINVAQYVIDKALSAPPVCRHLLTNGCYRSDCQFSHDVDGHTCLFWLRGRCGKGSGCKFLHGFSDNLLHGINITPSDATARPPTWQHAPPPFGPMRNGFMMPTTPQSQAYMQGQYYGQQPMGFNSFPFPMPTQQLPVTMHSHQQTGPQWHVPSSTNTLEHRMADMDLNKGAQQSGSSFAAIASKGKANGDFGGKTAQVSTNNDQSSNKQKVVRIPQDVWSPHINRDAGVFHIAHPIDRYNAVARSVSRLDVIDLHFQSTKTFPTVLSAILPLKLQQHGEAWVVTGTGNHVGKNTHQKGGGALEMAVLDWLEHQGYNFARGRDRNGHGGCILVKR